MIANCSYYIFTKMKWPDEIEIDFSLQYIDFDNQLSKTIGDKKNRINCYHISKIDRLSFRSIQAVSFDVFEKFFQIRYKFRSCCHDWTIVVIINLCLIWQHDWRCLIVHFWWKIYSIAFIIKNNEFIIQIIVRVVEFVVIFINFVQLCQLRILKLLTRRRRILIIFSSKFQRRRQKSVVISNILTRCNRKRLILMHRLKRWNWW